MASTDPFDLDNVLSIEEEAYNEGYNEGKSEALEETKQAGTLLGIQTGFQKLMFVAIADEFAKNTTASKGKLSINFDDIVNNDDKSVDKLTRSDKLARNWVQMNSFKGTVPKLRETDALVRHITGTIQTKDDEW